MQEFHKFCWEHIERRQEKNHFIHDNLGIIGESVKFLKLATK
ncbi:hypothetical protein NUACC26_087590 [Scytonema sp. NUACC26]